MKPSILALFASLLLSGPGIRAQLAPGASPTTPAAPDKDVVKLSVFQVTAQNDDEYRAAYNSKNTCHLHRRPFMQISA